MLERFRLHALMPLPVRRGYRKRHARRPGTSRSSLGWLTRAHAKVPSPVLAGPRGGAHLSPVRSPADDSVSSGTVAALDSVTVRTAAHSASSQPVAAAIAHSAAGQAGYGDGRLALETDVARRRMRGKQPATARRCGRAPHPLSPEAAEIMGQGRSDDADDAAAQRGRSMRWRLNDMHCRDDPMSPGVAGIWDSQLELGQRCDSAPPPLNQSLVEIVGRPGATMSGACTPVQRCASAPPPLRSGGNSERTVERKQR